MEKPTVSCGVDVTIKSTVLLDGFQVPDEHEVHVNTGFETTDVGNMTCGHNVSGVTKHTHQTHTCSFTCPTAIPVYDPMMDVSLVDTLSNGVLMFI